MKSVMQHDIFSYVRPNILSLAPYSTARDDYKGGIFLFGLMLTKVLMRMV